MAVGSATWTTLGALATATTRVRLGPLVACLPYAASPAILARAAADIDRLSDGRMVLGLGSGDIPREFGQFGMEWPSAAARQARLEETLRIVRPLLHGETVSFSGEYVRAEGAALAPPPVQQPYVPILIAGGGERTTLRYVAEYADACNLGAVGWAGGAYTPEDIAQKLGVLAERCREAGRPEEAVLRTGLALVILGESREAAQTKRDAMPAHFMSFMGHLPVVGTPEDAAAQVQILLAAGFQYLIFIVTDLETLQLLGERVLPAVAPAAAGTSSSTGKSTP